MQYQSTYIICGFVFVQDIPAPFLTSIPSSGLVASNAVADFVCTAIAPRSFVQKDFPEDPMLLELVKCAECNLSALIFCFKS